MTAARATAGDGVAAGAATSPWAAEPQKPRHQRPGRARPDRLRYRTPRGIRLLPGGLRSGTTTASRRRSGRIVDGARPGTRGRLRLAARDHARGGRTPRHPRRQARAARRARRRARDRLRLDAAAPRRRGRGRLSDRDRRALDAHMSGCLRCQATGLKTERAERAFRAKLKSGDETAAAVGPPRRNLNLPRSNPRRWPRRRPPRARAPGRSRPSLPRSPPRLRPTPLRHPRPRPRPLSRLRRSRRHRAARPSGADGSWPPHGAGGGVRRGRGGGRGDRALEQAQ